MDIVIISIASVNLILFVASMIYYIKTEKKHHLEVKAHWDKLEKRLSALDTKTEEIANNRLTRLQEEISDLVKQYSQTVERMTGVCKEDYNKARLETATLRSEILSEVNLILKEIKKPFDFDEYD